MPVFHFCLISFNLPKRFSQCSTLTISLLQLEAFQTDITFLTKLWLVCTETLVMALGGTMVAFAGFHILLSCKGMTTIEFLTRHGR